MRVLIQRVLRAEVRIDQQTKSQIGKGLLIFVGIEHNDTGDDIEWICHKIAGLRIFDDEHKTPNLSVMDIKGELLVVSQFTLHALVKKGNRPSYIRAAKPPVAIPLYEAFVERLEFFTGQNVRTGEFGADMKVALINDGPLTIWIDSKNRE